MNADKRVVTTCVSLLILLVAGGCSSSASLSSWQDSVVKYVQLNGNDPNVLRDVTLTGTRRGFGQIGGEDPRKSTDARGVLLAHRDISGRPWFVYLVGVVKSEKVDDIRLALLSYTGGHPTWHVSSKSPKSLKTYQHYNEGLWYQQHPGEKSKPTAGYTTFPRDEDRFDLAVNGSHAVATHTQSGAKWGADAAGKK